MRYSLKEREEINVVCKNLLCQFNGQTMKLKDYMAHASICLNKQALCPLGCKSKIKSIDEGISHFQDCPNNSDVYPYYFIKHINIQKYLNLK